MKYSIFAVVIIAAFVFIACEENSSGPCGCNSDVYYNSFNIDSDTTGWRGISPIMFVDETAPGIDGKSLHIGGGCFQPVAEATLTAGEPGKYGFSLWGRNDSSNIASHVVITASNTPDYSSDPMVEISDTEWRHYTAQKSIPLDTGDTLRIQIYAGGIQYATTYIDELKIFRLSDLF
jgi:hypothetical protein